MKKMNFYFNATLSRGLSVLAFIVLSTVSMIAQTVTAVNNGNPSCPSYSNGSIRAQLSWTAATAPTSGTAYTITYRAFLSGSLVSTVSSNVTAPTAPGIVVFSNLGNGLYDALADNYTVVATVTSGGSVVAVTPPSASVALTDVVGDPTPPVFSGFPTRTVTATSCAFTPAIVSGLNTRTVVTNLGTTFTENCSDITSVEFLDAALAPIATLPLGTTAVNVRATSAGGVTTTLVNVTVVDATAPTISLTVNGASALNNATTSFVGTTVVTYSTSTTDDCNVAPTFTPAVGNFATGTSLTPGTYTLSFTAFDGFNTTTLTHRIVVVNPNTVLACLGQVNVSLTSVNNCSQTLRDVDVLQTGSGSVEIKRDGIWGTPTYGTADLGRTYEYRVVNGTDMCWGYVTIEDKSAPVIGIAANVTMNCDNRNATNLFPLAPAATTPATLYVGTVTTNAAATATLAARTGIPMPSVTDCSQQAISFVDRVFLNRTCPLLTAGGAYDFAATAAALAAAGYTGPAAPANTTRVICRTYSAKDIFGNTSTSANVQYIFVVRNVTTPTAAPVALTCEDAYPAITSNVPTPAGVCGLSFSFLNDLRVDLCGKTYKVVRTWQIVDQCGTGTMASSITQIITVSDNVKPTLTVTGTSYDLTTVQTLTTCTSPAILKKLQPSNQTSGTIGGAAGATTGSITVNAWADATVCGMGTFSLKVAGDDNCGTTSITSSDSRYVVTAGVINGTVMGNTSFVVTSTDQCGNSVSVTVNVNVLDNLSPTAICDGVTATLNNYKKAVVTGASFNNRSSDNCGIVRILVARNNANVTPNAPGEFCESIEYGCGDATSTGLKVWVRYIDAAGNYTDCCVPITIVDKATISCIATTIPDVPCNDPRLTNVGAIFVAPTTFYDGCSTPATVVTNGSTTPGCGVNTYTRTWVYTITNSLGTQSATCSQTITTTPIRGFRATRLADQDVTCSGAVSTLREDQDAIIASLQLLHNGGTATDYSTCSAPVVDTTESIYRNSVYCRVIVRTFVIKDLCQFNPLTSSITGGNDYTTISGLNVQSIASASGHYLYFTRTIRIIDNTPPTSVPPTVADVCVTNTTCSFGFSATLSGDDGCGTAAIANARLFYSWRVVNAAGVTVNSGNGTAVSGSALPFGTYTVFYRVSDLCGNTSTEYSFTAKGSDCKAPEILVHNKIVELGGQPNTPATGMVTLNYRDIRNRITDNCEPTDLTNDSKITMEIGGVTTATRPTATVGTQSVMFTCAHAGTVQNVRVWAVDASNNWNYVVTQITVQDNIGICRATALVGGVVGTENNSPVKDVVISANANGLVVGSATSPAAGSFLVTNLTIGANYQVRAAKTIDTDKKNGVTTLDIALISKHNLGIEALNSPFKIIAADVNKDGEVDATDMLHIRRFILNITPTLPAGSAWRFIDKSYAFRNATNPLGEDFSEVVNLSSVPAGTSAANFTAVKLGDVNNSFDATQVRGSRALVLNANDMNVVAGNEYTVAINAENFNAAAFQGTFAFEGASVKAVKAGSLNNTSDANFGMFNNAVTASWNGKSEASADVVNITFVATKSGKLSDMLTVNSSVTMAEGYDAAGNAMNVSLKFNTGKVAGGEFALYQNTPNPVAASTTIGFNLPKDGQAKLTIYTAEGKVLSVINNTYKAGVNQVTVNKADLNASGMLYYRLDTQDNSSTRKMIIIE